MRSCGKIAIIFGGARGLGKACVAALLQQGAKVCIADVREEEGHGLVEKFKKPYPACIMYLKCDVTRVEDINAVFQFTVSQWGPVEICLNAAGICDEEDWQATMTINFNGSVHITHAAFEWMGTKSRGRGGIIIHTSSLMGFYGHHNCPHYAASTHAIVGYVRSFGKPQHLQETGIRVNAICPNFLPTDFLKESIMLDQESWLAIKDNGLQCGDLNSVVQALSRLIEDDTLNGECMGVNKTKGSFLIDSSKNKEFENMW